MEIIKTFDGGLNSDNFKQTEKQNEYSYAENIRLLAENAQNVLLENVKGTKTYSLIYYCEKQNNPYDPNNTYITKTMSLNGELFKAIGYCTVKDIAIILVSNGTIGYILIHKPSHILQDTHAFYSAIPLLSNTFLIENKFALALGYDIEYHDTYAEIRSDGNIYYYIAGRNNKKSRAILLSPNCPVCEKTIIDPRDEDLKIFDYFINNNYTEDNFDALTTIIPYSKDPIINLKGYDDPSYYYLAGIENSGNLDAGTWKYSIRYIDAFGNKTNWSPVSQEVPIYNGRLLQDRTIDWNAIYGNDTGTKCAKTVVLEISNLDLNFAQLELAGILNQDGIETAYIIKTVPISTTATSIVLKHTGNETYIPIDLTELTVKKVNIFNFETLKSIDNYLFIAGIKETLLKNYLPLQEIADKITLNWRTYTIPETEGTFSTYAGNSLAGLPDCRPKVGNYKIPYNHYYKLGYFRDEDYSFGIQFKLKDGSYTPVFPIGKADYDTKIPNLYYTANQGENNDSCGGTIPSTYGHQQLNNENILLQDVPLEKYNMSIDGCKVDKTYSYYQDGAYIYRTPAHINGYEIIDGDPMSQSQQNNLISNNPSIASNVETRYVLSNMGRPRYVRVLHPEFMNIQIPDDSNIEGYYILRADRKKYGRIKSTGISCISVLDYGAYGLFTNDNRFYLTPPTPTFLNYLTQYDDNAYLNRFKITGTYPNQWAPVFGYWSFDEIYANDKYDVIPNEDVLEHIYCNLPLHSNSVGNTCGYPSVDGSGLPTTESNFWVYNMTCSTNDNFDQSLYQEQWFQRLYLLLWTGTGSSILPKGNYQALGDQTVLYAEVNMWQKIQNKEFNSTHKGICDVVNYASPLLQGDGYEFNPDICNIDWKNFFMPTGTRIRVDLTTLTPVYHEDCGTGSNEINDFYIHSHPCKLISVKDYLDFLYGIQSRFDTTPSQEAIALGGKGLVYYSQIRKLKHQYVPPVYREYMYCTLYQPVLNNKNVTYGAMIENNTQIGVVHNNLHVFGGDCYIGKYYLQIQKRDRSPLDEQLAGQGQGVPQSQRYRSLHVSVYAESMHNISLINVLKNDTGGVLNYGHFPYFSRCDIDAGREDADLFATEGTGYNLGYTTYKNTFAQAVKSFSEEEDLTLYQIKYSLKQLDILKEDQYRIFLPNNFADAIRRYGKVVKLEALNELLILGQEDGVGYYRVSQSAQVPSTAGEIKLAISNVLSEKPEYYAKENEIGVQDLFGIYNESNSLIIFDKKRKQIASIGKGLDILSKTKGINSLIRSLVYEQKKHNLPVFISKNRAYDELFIKMKHDKAIGYKSIDVPDYETFIPDTLMYSLALNKFISFFNYSSDVEYSINDKYFGIGKHEITNNLVLAEHNVGRRGEFYGKVYDACVKHNVVAKTNSTFDSIKIFGNSEYLDKKYRVFKDRIEVFPISAYFRTSYQYGVKDFFNNYNIRDILFSTQNNVPIDNILYKEQVWHTDFPFAIPIDNSEWKIIDYEKNLQQEFYSEERLRDFYCEVLWKLNNGETYDPNSEDYAKYGDKRYRWLYILYLANPSSI